MTYSPEGARPQGQGPGGYGNYGPAGQYGQPGQQPGQSPQPGQPQPGQPQPGQSQPGQPSYGQGQQAPSQQQYNPPLASAGPSQLPRILTLVVLVLGVVSFLTGLAGQYEALGTTTNFFLIGNGDPTSIALLLAAGGVAAVGLLPKQPVTIGIAAVLAIAGWLVLVFQSFNTGDTGPTGVSIGLGTGAIVVLVLGFVQSVAAVAATLFSAEILKVPAPKPVSYGQQNAFQGYGQPQYGQPGQSGQQGRGQQPQNYSGYGQPAQQNYTAPSYSGQPSPTQNTTGSLGYPVGGSPSAESAPGGNSGLTGPAGQNSPYGQPQYGQQPIGSGGYGAPQHAVPSEPESDDSAADRSTPYGAPTQAFGAAPQDEDKK
nr:DUF5336 domain-containing protein [Rhodococcus sp. (in: high G+C Gram-positive bacteria)]